jgi:hypothetical protein
VPKPAAPPATMRAAIDLLTARSEELARIDITKLSDQELIYYILEAETIRSLSAAVRASVMKAYLIRSAGQPKMPQR